MATASSSRAARRYKPRHYAARHDEARDKTFSPARIGVILGALGLVVVGGGLAAVETSTQHSVQPAVPTLPYPLDIPVAHRTGTQLVEGRLMLAPHLSATGQLDPLPKPLVSKVTDPAAIAEIRLSRSIPTLTWTNGASWGSSIASIDSTSPTTTSYTIAMRSGSDCEYLSYDNGAVRYTSVVLKAGQSCAASKVLASRWRPSWPTS